VCGFTGAFVAGFVDFAGFAGVFRAGFADFFGFINRPFCRCLYASYWSASE
jgi:hypothetical protein